MKRAIIVIAAIAAVGLLAGCGSGTSASPATVTTTQATTATVTVSPTTRATTSVSASSSGTSSSVSSSGTSSSSGTPLSGTTPLSATSALPQSMRVTEMESVDSAGTISKGQAAISGTTYVFSQLLDTDYMPNAWVEYNLSRNWTNLHTVVGLSDDSRAISDLKYIISVDGVIVSQGDMRLGTATPLDIPVTNALRLRLEVVDVNAETPNASGTLVYGDPTVTK